MILTSTLGLLSNHQCCTGWGTPFHQKYIHHTQNESHTLSHRQNRKMEDWRIELQTSCMLSTRSTNWARPPSTALLSYLQMAQLVYKVLQNYWEALVCCCFVVARHARTRLPTELDPQVLLLQLSWKWFSTFTMTNFLVGQYNSKALSAVLHFLS